MHTLLRRSFRATIITVVTAAALFLPCGAHAQQKSYILPDIGTPGMATYIEGVGPADVIGNFGSDGLYLNNAESAVRLECVNPADTHRIIIGPVVVGWGGRMFSSHVFVAPFVTAGSHDWRQAPPEDVIPLRLVKNGSASNSVLFRILRPSPAFRLTGETVLGENGQGIRSPRGAMIFETLDLSNAQVRCSTRDCDTTLPGNQGYLPAVVLVRGKLTGDGLSSLDVSAHEAEGGPGGGGGAGSFCFGDSVGMPAGGGFSAGGAGGRNAGASGLSDDRYTAHAQGSGMAVDGSGASLNGRMPGLTHGYLNAAGGTGHPFGDSGSACAVVIGCNAPGGRGGGSGADAGEEAGGGGNASDGAPLNRPQRGLTHGNRQIFPLAGGSGGASGTPTQLLHCSGRGGGGGGALRLFAMGIGGISVISEGAPGGIGDEFADGGSGSGGSLVLASKLASSVESISVLNGSASATEGIGRLRLDGEIQSSITRPAAADVYLGPATDTTSFIRRSSILLTGRGDGNRIRLYLKSSGAPWTQIATVLDYPDTRWSITLELPGNEQLYYLVAVQENPNPNADWYVASPRFVLSQAAFNLFRNSEAAAKLKAPGGLSIAASGCEPERLDTIRLENVSPSPLTIRATEFRSGGSVFSLLPGEAFPLVIPAGIAHPLILRSETAGLPAGLYTDTLRLFTDDMTLPGQRFDIAIQMRVDSFGVAVDKQDLRFGIIDMCGSRMSESAFQLRNTGSAEIIVELPAVVGDDVAVIEPDPAQFPLRLAPGTSATMHLRCTPAYTPEMLTGAILLRARMQQCMQEVMVSYTAATDSAWLTGDELLDFGTLSPEQFPAVRSVTIFNPSARAVTLQRAEFPAGSPYSVRAVADSAIEPHETLSLELACSDPCVSGPFSETLYLETDPICADYSIVVQAVRRSAELSIAAADASGEAGDTVRIMVTVQLSRMGTLEKTMSVYSTLEMNASMLVPFGESVGSVRDGIRSIPLRIDVSPGTQGASIALPFIVTLGDSDTTALRFTSTRLEVADVDLTEVQGRFSLLGVCREGGSRLFDGRLRAGIVSLSPHPFRGASEVRYRAIERGIHQVALHDALGRRLRVLQEAEQVPGEFSITLDAPDLRPGLHYIVLTTPSARYVKPLLISQ